MCLVPLAGHYDLYAGKHVLTKMALYVDDFYGIKHRHFCVTKRFLKMSIFLYKVEK